MNGSYKIYVYYDNWCPKSVGFLYVISRLDVFKKIVFVSLREIKNIGLTNLDLDLAYKKVASTENYSKWNYGYASLHKIFKRIPLMWLLIPIFYLLRISGGGDFLYNELAVKRNVIPLNCDENCKKNHSIHSL